MKAKTLMLVLLILLLSVGMIFANSGREQSSSSSASSGQRVVTNVTPRALPVTTQYPEAGEKFTPKPATSYSTNPRYPRQPAVSNPGGYPVVQSPMTITVAHPHHSYNMDYDNNDAIKFLNALTNVTPKWDILPEVGTTERLNLMLAAGQDLPDAFVNCPFTTGMLITAGQQGLLIPMQDLLDQTYYYKDLVTEYPEVWGASHSADGNVYAWASGGPPMVTNQLAMRFWIFQPFLTALNMRMPTTTDEYYNFLVAVRDRDPNGNGRRDEIGLVGETEGWHAQIDGFLMNSFIYNETSTSRDAINRRRMYLKDDGTIDVTYNKPEWRQGLEYLTKLCSEGLMDPSSFTYKKEERRALVEIAGAPIVASLPSGGFHEFSDPQGERRKQFVNVPPLRGPSGVRQIWYDQYNSTAVGRVAISKDCQWPEVVVKWADYVFTPDWAVRNRYGVRNRDWEIPPPGTPSASGGGAKIVEKLRWGTPQTVGIQNSVGRNVFFSYDSVFSGDIYELEYVLWNSYVQNEPFKFMKSVPRNLTFTVEETRDFNNLNILIVEYIEQFMAQVITGRIQLNDTTWNNYTREIDRMGLPQLLRVTQAAFDRSWASALGYKR